MLMMVGVVGAVYVEADAGEPVRWSESARRAELCPKVGGARWCVRRISYR